MESDRVLGLDTGKKFGGEILEDDGDEVLLAVFYPPACELQVLNLIYIQRTRVRGMSIAFGIGYNTECLTYSS